VDYLDKDINDYFREDFTDQRATLYPLRQVIGAGVGFSPVKVEAGSG
jgi:hypothetical protein